MYKSCIEWVLEQWGEPDQPEDGVNFVIPMPRAVPKSIEHPFKEPIFIRGGSGITARRANNSNLVGRKDALTECVFTITLTKGTTRHKTGANLLLFFQTRSSWFPKTTMQDLA